MKEMNERERLEAILDGDPYDRPAVISVMQTAPAALMKEANAYYPEIQDHPEKMARLAMAGHKFLGFESARVPFDESVEASAFGAATGQANIQRHPIILRHLIKGPEDVDRLEIPDPRKAGRTPLVIEAVRILDTEKKTMPVLIGIISPLMLAMQLRGDNEVMSDMVNDKALLHKLLDRTTTFILDYMKAAFDAGADQLVLDDSLSSGDFLTMEQFREFAEPYEDRVANECRRYDFESILHVCGDSRSQMERMLEVDTDGISIDQDVSVAWVKRLAKSKNRKIAVIGNLCPTRTLLMGDRQLVIEMTKKCIDEGVDAVAPRCSLEMYTPLDNILGMTQTAKSYGLQRAQRSIR